MGAQRIPLRRRWDNPSQGGEVVATVTLEHAFEGAPGRAHGGMVAAIFDDITGHVPSLIGVPAFTVRLAVDYLAPTVIGVRHEFRARLDRREGRKLFVTADAQGEGTLVARPEALFVVVDPERFDARAGISPGPGRSALLEH